MYNALVLFLQFNRTLTVDTLPTSFFNRKYNFLSASKGKVSFVFYYYYYYHRRRCRHKLIRRVRARPRVYRAGDKRRMWKMFLELYGAGFSKKKPSKNKRCWNNVKAKNVSYLLLIVTVIKPLNATAAASNYSTRDSVRRLPSRAPPPSSTDVRAARSRGVLVSFPIIKPYLWQSMTVINFRRSEGAPTTRPRWPRRPDVGPYIFFPPRVRQSVVDLFLGFFFFLSTVPLPYGIAPRTDVRPLSLVRGTACAHDCHYRGDGFWHPVRCTHYKYTDGPAGDMTSLRSPVVFSLTGRVGTVWLTERYGIKKKKIG